MKVLVTGGGGFIGSHLVDSQLARGNYVRAIDLHRGRLEHVANHPNLEIISGDILDNDLVRQSVEGIDIIYHLASAHLDVSLDEEHYRRVNVDATLDLLESAREAGVQRVVHCSSVGVIGDVGASPADETAACRPTNIYERTKLEGEQAALEFAHRTACPLVVVRPAWVYGPRCPRTEKLLRTISKGRFPIFGSGKNMRHPIFISDAVHGIELCAEVENISGEIFIIAGDEPVQVIQLVRVISQQLGVHPPNIHLPLTLGMMGGLTLELMYKLLGRQPPFSRRSLDFFSKHNANDISKARSELGFQPRVDLPTGIQMTINWQKDKPLEPRN